MSSGRCRGIGRCCFRSKRGPDAMLKERDKGAAEWRPPSRSDHREGGSVRTKLDRMLWGHPRKLIRCDFLLTRRGLLKQSWFSEEHIVAVLHEWDASAGGGHGALPRRHRADAASREGEVPQDAVDGSQAARTLGGENCHGNRLVVDQSLNLLVVMALPHNRRWRPSSGGAPSSARCALPSCPSVKPDATQFLRARRSAIEARAMTPR